MKYGKWFMLFVAAGMLTVSGCEWGKKKEPPQLDVSKTQAYNDARQVLLHSSGSTANPSYRAHAMEAIGKVLSEQDGQHLMEGLDDQYIVVQFASAMGIGRMRYAPATTKLERIVMNPKSDIRVVAGSIYALHKMGNKAYTGQLGALLQAPQAQARANTAMVLGFLGEKSAIKPLKSMLPMEEESSAARYTIIEALARLGDAKSRQLLESFALDRRQDTYLAAISAIGEVGSPGSIRLLKRLTQSYYSPRVRVAAAGALGAMKQADDDDLKVCLDALETPHALFETFAEGQDTTVEGLGVKPEHYASLKRLGAIGLGNIGDPRALGLLHNALNDPDGSVRIASAMAIIQIIAPKESNDGRFVPKPDATGQRPKLHTSGGMDKK